MSLSCSFKSSCQGISELTRSISLIFFSRRITLSLSRSLFVFLFAYHTPLSRADDRDARKYFFEKVKNKGTRERCREQYTDESRFGTKGGREREGGRSVCACSRHGTDKLHLEVANRRPARKTDAKREEGPHR